MSDSSYDNICHKIWALYGQTESHPVGRGGKRNFLLPPPRREKPVTLLIVGISPFQDAVGVRFTHTLEAMKSFAARFEYVPGGPEGNGYKFYYSDLLNLVRRVDPRLGVWWELLRAKHELLVEFTDALPVATSRGDDDIKQFLNVSDPADPVRTACKELLELQLNYYQPKVVLGNGRLPSTLLWELCAGRVMPIVPPTAFFPKSRFNCSVHLSGFIPNAKLDAFNRARLVAEMLQQWPKLTMG
jgi:hypothetical protein